MFTLYRVCMWILSDEILTTRVLPGYTLHVNVRENHSDASFSDFFSKWKIALFSDKYIYIYVNLFIKVFHEIGLDGYISIELLDDITGMWEEGVRRSVLVLDLRGKNWKVLLFSSPPLPPKLFPYTNHLYTGHIHYLFFHKTVSEYCVRNLGRVSSSFPVTIVPFECFFTYYMWRFLFRHYICVTP